MGQIRMGVRASFRHRAASQARVLAVASALLLWPSAAAPVQAGTGDGRSDFNGDGHMDLAVGIPGEDVDDADDAGAVEVIYGTFDGLDGDQPIDDQFWTQDSPGVQEAAEDGDRFGAALASGDFDGDGLDDLAIGVPTEDVPTSAGEIADAGAVHVLYGSPSGLTASGDDLWTQDSSGVLDRVESGDRFGSALEGADFGKGSAKDLAVGVPLENVGSLANAGAVHVLYGAASGLTAADDQVWTQDSAGTLGHAEAEDRYGSSLAAGDVGKGGQADLVVGVPKEDVPRDGGTVRNAGGVHVLYGSSNGLTAIGDQFWTEESAGIRGVAQRDDGFGTALAVGNLGNGSREDVAIGSPKEDIGGSNEGVVHVIYGSDAGLRYQGNQVWHQDVRGIEGDAEGSDLFGAALAIADFGRESQEDLAVGVPGEDKERTGFDREQAGAVNVIYGTAAGLTAAGEQFWWQDSSGIGGESENSDGFGASLAAADYGNGSRMDLAVGVPGEMEEHTIGVESSVGAVNVIYGTSEGLSSAGDQFWWQASDTLKDSAETSDRFGSTLAD